MGEPCNCSNIAIVIVRKFSLEGQSPSHGSCDY